MSGIAEYFPAASAFVAVGGAFAGVARWLVKLSQRADETMKSVVALTARLEKVEDLAPSVRDLAAAVRHQADMQAQEIRGLIDKIGEQSQFAKEGFADVKGILREQDKAISEIKVKIAKLS